MREDIVANKVRVYARAIGGVLCLLIAVGVGVSWVWVLYDGYSSGKGLTLWGWLNTLYFLGGSIAIAIIGIGLLVSFQRWRSREQS